MRCSLSWVRSHLPGILKRSPETRALQPREAFSSPLRASSVFEAKGDGTHGVDQSDAHDRIASFLTSMICEDVLRYGRCSPSEGTGRDGERLRLRAGRCSLTASVRIVSVVDLGSMSGIAQLATDDAAKARCVLLRTACSTAKALSAGRLFTFFPRMLAAILARSRHEQPRVG